MATPKRQHRLKGTIKAQLEATQKCIVVTPEGGWVGIRALELPEADSGIVLKSKSTGLIMYYIYPRARVLANHATSYRNCSFIPN